MSGCFGCRGCAATETSVPRDPAPAGLLRVTGTLFGVPILLLLVAAAALDSGASAPIVGLAGAIILFALGVQWRSRGRRRVEAWLASPEPLPIVTVSNDTRDRS